MSNVGGLSELYTHPYDVMIITGINIHERLYSALPGRQAGAACGVSTWWRGDGNGGPSRPSSRVWWNRARRHYNHHHQPPASTSLIPDVDLTLPVSRHSLSLSVRNMS